MENLFEYMIQLTRNAKCGTGWVAEITENDDLKFLNKVEGDDYNALYLFENNKYYIIKRSGSSWKNSRQHYTLCYTFNNKLINIATISFINSYSQFEIELDVDEKTANELKKMLRRFYATSENCKSKTINALIRLKNHLQNTNIEKMLLINKISR